MPVYMARKMIVDKLTTNINASNEHYGRRATILMTSRGRELLGKDVDASARTIRPQ